MLIVAMEIRKKIIIIPGKHIIKTSCCVARIPGKRCHNIHDPGKRCHNIHDPGGPRGARSD